MAMAGIAAGRLAGRFCGISALKEDHMEIADTVIAVFVDHQAAETAVKKLTAAGFEMKNLSVVGKGYHTEERVVGFYNVGDRVKFWGKRGAFWGGPWGLFFGGLAEQRHAEQGPGFPELNKFGNGVFSVGGNVCDVDDAPLKRSPSGNGPTVHRR